MANDAVKWLLVAISTMGLQAVSWAQDPAGTSQIDGK